MKRLLVFVLLLAAGIVGLWLAIGDEAAVVAKTGGQNATETPRGPGGVSVGQGNLGVRVSQTGRLTFPQYRTVPQPDGSARSERVYQLEAEDSEPITESLQQMERVTVTFFEDDREVAKLFSQRAFLELSRDASGKPSLREDKEIDLRDAVFETLPGARLEGLRLELGNARIRVGDAEVQLRTANEDDPVRLVLTGDRDATLRGKGLQARLPRGKDSALRRADVSILRDPVLATEGMVVRARGQLDYREDLDTGAAIVTLDDDTQVDLARGAGAAGGEVTTRIRGDRFTGWLLRGGKRTGDPTARGDVAWDRLLLTGAPATVELPEGTLRTPRISVLPGPSGEPWIVTAHGGASRIEQTRTLPGSRLDDLVTGTSPRRIHLVRTGEGAGALLRAFGFPQWSLQSLGRTHVVVFEGDARLDGGARTVTASRGLHLFHSTDSGGMAARGFGKVHIEQRATKPGEHDLLADGDDGFALRATETAQQLQLGPGLSDRPDDGDAPWRRHRYEIRYGPATATGVGVCKFDRDGERARLWLRAPGTEIRGRLADQLVDLTDVRQLDVELVGDAVQALEAAGLPARARRDGTDDTIAAAAPLLRRIGPRSLRLERAPDDGDTRLWHGLAEADALPLLQRTVTTKGRTATADVRGPWIDVHHVGRDDVVVEAQEVDGVQPVLDVVFADPDGGEPVRAHCTAERVRALPFALSREAALLHAGGSQGAFAFATFASAGQPWLLVDGVRHFRLVDPRQGVVEGHGKRLLLSQGAQAGIFVGDPDAGEPAEVRRTLGGRELTATGARVRVFRERDLRLQALRTFEDRPTFLLPSVTLREPASSGLLSHMRAVCQGHIDVLPDRVVFGGPVTAHGLDATGAPDPDGIALDARELLLLRDRTTGELAQANGRDVRVDSPRLRARAAEVELDVLRTRCLARDPVGATVVLPGGLEVTAPFVEANYETMSLRARNGRMAQAADAGAEPR